MCVTTTGTTRTCGHRPKNRQPKREKWVARLLGLAVWLPPLLLGAGAFLACRSCSWPGWVSGCPSVVVCPFFGGLLLGAPVSVVLGRKPKNWPFPSLFSPQWTYGSFAPQIFFLLDVNGDVSEVTGTHLPWYVIPVRCSLFLGTQMRGCQYVYYFGPAFQNEEQCTVLVARAGLDCAANRRVIKKVGSSLEVEESANSHLKDAQRNMHELSVDYLGRDWTMAGKLMLQGAFLF